jgi:DNA polymerase V
VFIISNRHRKDLPQYSKNIIVNLPFPTNSSIEIAKYAVEGFERIFREGYEYKKAGVIVMEITPERNRQTTLFGQSDERHAPLMIIMDNINKSIGVKKIKLGGQDLDRTWKMKQEKLSPRFSTKLKDVIKIKAAEF